MLLNLVANLVSMAIGAIITWAVARHYYDRATKDLEGLIRQLERTIVAFTA